MFKVAPFTKFDIAVFTNLVFAICVLLFDAVTSGVVGMPVKCGESNGANPDEFMALLTNSVLAICVVLVPSAAVGAVGTPVKCVEWVGMLVPDPGDMLPNTKLTYSRTLLATVALIALLAFFFFFSLTR